MEMSGHFQALAGLFPKGYFTDLDAMPSKGRDTHSPSRLPVAMRRGRHNLHLPHLVADVLVDKGKCPDNAGSSVPLR
jgi:hypothetical protein